MIATYAIAVIVSSCAAATPNSNHPQSSGPVAQPTRDLPDPVPAHGPDGKRLTGRCTARLLPITTPTPAAEPMNPELANSTIARPMAPAPDAIKAKVKSGIFHRPRYRYDRTIDRYTPASLLKPILGRAR